jgi:hypothetical protein
MTVYLLFLSVDGRGRWIVVGEGENTAAAITVTVMGESWRGAGFVAGAPVNISG